MNFFLLITDTNGESRIVPVDDVQNIPVNPGDDVVVMDEKGNPVDVSLRPDGENLVVDFGDGTKAVLEGFYKTAEGEESITISLNPVEPVGEEYEFNSQTGNLPNAKGFTLMRYSNTEYIQFVEQLDELNVGELTRGVNAPGRFDDEDLILDPVPAAAPDSGSGLDGTTINIDLLSNDTDARGGGLEIHAVGGIGVVNGSNVTLASGSSVTVNSDGTIDFVPGSNFDALQVGQSATETFVYSVRDAGGNIATSQVTVTVNGVNDPPTANPDEFTLTEDAPVTVNVLNNDSDPDTSDTLTVTGISTPPPGTSAVVNGDNTVTFDPGGQYENLAVGESATVTLTYTIADDAGASATSTVTFTVNGANDAPDAINDSDTTAQGVPVTIDVLANDTDPDASDSLTVTGVTQPAQGSVTYNSDDLRFDPGSDFDYLDAGESATITFTYDISDGNGGTDTATVTVTVTGTDDATDTNPDTAVTDEETAVTIDVLANDTDVDTSDIPLAVASVTQPTDANDGMVVNNGTNVTFTPGTNFNSLAAGESATTTFTYTTDTGITENVTVTVNGVNDVPTANTDADVTDQDTATTIDVIANDTDPDGSDVLLITGVGQPSRGVATIDENNEIVFHPNGEFDDLDAGESATVTFDYNISDGNGGTDTATVTVTVTGADDATDTNPDTDITDEDTAVTIDVLANDTDVDTSDNPLAVASVTQPTDANDGMVVNNGTNVTFTPGSNFNSLAVGESATTAFTYTTDTGATENVTVTVHGVNDAPTANPDADVTDQDTSIMIDVVSNDTDPDGSDDLIITGVDQPSRGVVTIDGSNQIAFDPNGEFDDLDAGESATVTFDYNISDGNGGTDTATVTVTVTGADDATDTNPDTDITDEDTAVTIDVLANDTDVDTSDNPLAVASVTQPTDANDGMVVNNGTNVTFTPGSNFNSLAVGESATTAFTYTTDTGATENVTVTVHGVNDAPTANPDADVTDQDTATTIDVVANDTDPDGSDELIITGVDQPSRGTVTIDGNNQISFDPNGEFDDLESGESATVTFDYNISDGNGGTDTATVTVTVTGADDATDTNPDTDITDEDTAVTIDVLANDTDVDTSDNPLAVASVTQPTDANDGMVVNNGTNVTFTPGSNFNSLAVGESATTAFTYTTDTGATENVTVTVHGVNDAPTANPDADVTDQNTATTIDVVANDTDPDGSDELIVTGVDKPSGGTVTIDSDNQLVFDPDGDFDYLDAGESATVTFDYNISDGNGGTDTATVTVTVTGTEDATDTNPDSASTDEDTAVTIDVLANDTDPDSSDNPLAVASVTQPTDANDGMVVNNGTDVTFTPGSNFQGLAVGESATTTFTYTTDTGETENVTVTINGVNDDPNAIDDSDVTDQDTSVTIDVLTNDTDPDTNDTLLVTGVTQPTKGSVTYNVGNVTFHPGDEFDDLDVGESETVTFTYDITDGKGGTDTATVTVTVTGTEDASVTNPDVDVTNEDTAVVVDVLANDSDPDTSDNPLSVASVTQPTDANDGMVVNNGTNVTFTPGSNFNSLAVGESGTTTFTYTTDTGSTENVTITVTGLNDAPNAVDDSDTTDQNSTTTIDVVANDVDPDTTDTLIVTSVDQPSKGVVSINSSNQVVFDPNSEFDSLDSGESETVTFDYSISDGNGGTDTATVTVTVTGVEDASVTQPDSATTTESTAITVDVLANDSDVDSSDNPLTIANFSAPAKGLVTNNGTDLTFDPNGEFESLAVGESETVTFTYTTDTGSTETVTITVVGENDAPTAVDDADATNQDSTVNIDLIGAADSTGPDVDPDGDALTISQINGVSASGTILLPSGARVAVNADGTVDYDPNGQFDYLDMGETALDTFTYVASDGNGGQDSATVTVTINGLDDATNTNPDSAVTNADTSVNVDVLANDSDIDSSDNPLSIASVTQPADVDDGTAVIAGGVVTFTPGSNFDTLGSGQTATTTFTYTTDTGVTENVTITVIGVNDPPVANDDGAGTTQGTPTEIDVLSNDSDPNSGDVLQITAVDQPAIGTTSITSGNRISFDPGDEFDYLDDGETATVTFDYSISDGKGGTDTATVTVTVTGTEDSTSTSPDFASTDEDSSVTVDVLSNDSDIDTSDNPLSISSVSQPADTSDGVVVNNGSDLTFTPGNNFNSLDIGESATTTFTYTTNTGATENVTVTVYGRNDAPTLSNTTTSGTVYESGLPNGTGVSPTTTSVTGTFVASDVDGDNLILRVNGTDLGSLNGNPSTVVGAILGDDQNGRLSVYGDGSWRYDLIDEAEHDSDDSTFIASEIEQFTVTVFDGTVESAPVGLTVNIVDDEIVVGTPSSPTITNTAGETFTGSLGVTGADSDSGSLTGAITGWDGTTTTFAASTETSRGDTIYYYVDPADESTLIAYTDTSGSPAAYDATDPDQTLVFTMEVDPSNNEFEFTLSQPVDNIESILVDFGSLSAAGPQDSYRFTDGPSLLAPTDPIPAGETVVFSAYGIDPGDQVNSNASYMGLNNNLVDPTEAGVAIDLIEEDRAVTIEYLFNGGGSNTIISWTAYGTDDSTVLATGTHDSMGVLSGSFTVSYDRPILGKVEISSFDNNTTSFRISTITVDGRDSDTPLDLDFPVTITDQDGDSASTTVTVSLDNPATPPVVIDLDGDGVEFDGIDEGILFDADGDGDLEQIAWADEDDGVLVYDGNDNGQIDGLDEVAFARYSDDPDATDLEGLRHFDTNDDLVLDANDDEFESFKIWQDRDGDGEVGDGEMMTLSEAGIESLELQSDEQPYYTAGGDVLVHGEATVHYADGSEGVLADARFEYEELDGGDESLEVVGDDGQVIDVNEGGESSEPVGDDLLEGDGGQTTGPDAAGEDSAAPPATSGEDDQAAADAAMS